MDQETNDPSKPLGLRLDTPVEGFRGEPKEPPLFVEMLEEFLPRLSAEVSVHILFVLPAAAKLAA